MEEMTILLPILLIYTFKTETYQYCKECTLETNLETIYKKQAIKLPSLKHHLKVLYSIINSQKTDSCSNEKITNDEINCYFRRDWRGNEGAVEFLYCQTIQQSQAQGKMCRKNWTARTSWDSDSHQQDDLVCWHFAFSCNIQELLHFFKKIFSSFSKSVYILKNGGQLKE